ncbi:MAG: YoaK family protein [Luteibacter sp.]
MVPVFPRWTWLWVLLLPVVAGSVNVTALLFLQHGGITHLTGVTTEAAAGIGRFDWALLAHAGVVVCLYCLGCAVSGYVHRLPRWVTSRRAAALLACEALFIAMVAGGGLSRLSSLACLALAMGLQNGLTTVVSGALLRTTHLTGMFTDAAVAVGQSFAGVTWDRRRVMVCVTVIAGFVAGGILAGAGFGAAGLGILWLPATMAGAVAAATVGLSIRHTAQVSDP